MNGKLVLYRDGNPVDLNECPSLLAALHANDRSITRNLEVIAGHVRAIDELGEKIDRYVRMGMSAKGLRTSRTRRRNWIKRLEKENTAFRAGYLEIPAMRGRFLETRDPNDGRVWSGESLPANVPIDVIRALEHAHDMKIFDRFDIIRPEAGARDPFIVGVIYETRFYVASWR